MIQRSLVTGLCLAALGAVASVEPARAQSAAQQATSGPGELIVDARTHLARMHQAALKHNYRGTLAFTVGGQLSSSRVAHYFERSVSYELIEALDGRMQRVYRVDGAVHTVWPHAGVVIVEMREAMGHGASLMQIVESRAAEAYEMRGQGRDHVAGREADVFLLVPRDEWRYAQRLWADVASGLMLRADVLSAAHQVLESSAFTDVEIGVRAQPEAVLSAIKQAKALRELRARHERTALEAEGWAMPRPLPGFQLASTVRRPQQAMPVLRAEKERSDRPDREPPMMLQVVLSDGLTHLSLFIERFDPERHRKEVQARMGATATWMQRRGEFWLTAVGDVPPATLKRLLDAIERR
jgi:sigma-E factor negative regulatory protein RseB